MSTSDPSTNRDIRPYRDIVAGNIHRITRLISLAEKEPDFADDLLRAAVVLTHAYLEDVLRSIAKRLLPTGSEAVLNDIPLAGLGDQPRAERFQLGKLVKHKGKLVDEVIRESVSDYLERHSFNSVDDIVRLLQRLGFETEPYKKLFPGIGEMIKRRHLIVHQTDRISFGGTAGFTLQAFQPIRSMFGSSQPRSSPSVFLAVLPRK